MRGQPFLLREGKKDIRMQPDDKGPGCYPGKRLGGGLDLSTGERARD